MLPVSTLLLAAILAGSAGATPKPPNPGATRSAVPHQPQIEQIVAAISAQRIEAYVAAGRL